MWFLWFYLISLGISLIATLIVGKAIANKIKREHPEIKVKKKSSFSELVSAFLPFTIPFLNLVFVLSLILQQDKMYNATLEKFKSNGEVFDDEI